MTTFRSGLLAAASACLLFAGTAQAQTYVTTTRTYSAPVVVHENIMGMRHARNIALGIEPGRVESGALVRDRLGEPLYVFHIRNSSGLYGVSIDATTGEVVENVQEEVRIRHENFWDRLFAPMNSGD